MSRASRERERQRLLLRIYRGFPDFYEFRIWQRVMLANYTGPFQPWPIREWVEATYPEPEP